VPPEFIGFGRALQQLSAVDLQLLISRYPNLASDLVAAGRYLNLDNLEALASRNPSWKAIQTDIAAAEAVLGVKFGPKTRDEQQHRQLTAHAMLAMDQPRTLQRFIDESAALRKSLG